MKRSFCLIIAAAVCCGAMPATACRNDDGRTDYRISAQYSNGTLTAECEVDYYNASAPTGTLEFNIYPNAYRSGAQFRPVSDELRSRAYYAGTSYGGMEITAVDGAKEWKICGSDENILQVTLPDTLETGGRATVTLSYELTLAKVNHRTGITQRTVNLGNFYPTVCTRTEDGGFLQCEYYSDGDPFASDCADYTVELTLPAGLGAAASGMQTGADGNTLFYELKNARDFCIVLSDGFEKLTADAGGTPVNYYHCDDAHAEEVLDAAAQALAYFEDKFGEYEYPQLNIVQTGFAAGGMEYPALAMISDELSGDDAIYATVHEVAHQWWYAMVGSDQLNCAWQDEGLAEYSTLCFFEEHPQYGYTRAGIVHSATEAYRAFYSVYGQLFGDADTTMNRHLKDFLSDYEYVNIAYNKGLLLFETLRSSVGDDKFFGALKSYFEDMRGKTATADALQKCFEKHGGDLSGVFESFIEGKVII